MNDEQRINHEVALSDCLTVVFDEEGRLIDLKLHDNEYYSLDYDGHELLNFISSFQYLKRLYIYLTYSEVKFTNLSKLGSLLHLEHLVITNCELTDIWPLASLQELEILSLSGAFIQSIEALRELRQLTTLSLPNNSITDIEPLRKLKKLTDLYLANNKITDISPLDEHDNLVSVDLSNNLLTDISPLSYAISLQSLVVERNKIINLAPVAALTELTVLHVDHNRVEDILPLKSLEKLVSLTLSNNPIADISPLEPLINLDLLEISGIPVDNLQPIRRALKLKKLIASHVKNFDGCVFAELKNITGLSLHYCQISDVSFVRNLTELVYIELDNNDIEDAAPLLAIPGLHRVSLRNNRISKPFLTYPYRGLILDLSNNPFGNKNYQNFNEYLSDAAYYYYQQGDWDNALVYHYIDASGKIPLLIYYRKLVDIDPVDNYYLLYYVMRCEQLLKKIDEKDEEEKAIQAHLVEIIKVSNFFNYSELMVSLVDNGKAVSNYEPFSEYIAYLKSAPNPKPNPELAHFLAKTFLRQDDLPQLLSIYQQLLDKGSPFHFSVYRMIKNVLSSEFTFKEYDHYLDLLFNIRDREIPYFDIFQYLDSIFGNYVHDQPPIRPKSKDWQDQHPDNNTGWMVAFWLFITSLAFWGLLKGCS